MGPGMNKNLSSIAASNICVTIYTDPISTHGGRDKMATIL